MDLDDAPLETIRTGHVHGRPALDPSQQLRRLAARDSPLSPPRLSRVHGPFLDLSECALAQNSSHRWR